MNPKDKFYINVFDQNEIQIYKGEQYLIIYDSNKKYGIELIPNNLDTIKNLKNYLKNKELYIENLKMYSIDSIVSFIESNRK